MASIDEYRERVESVLASLQISPRSFASRALPLCQEPEILVIAEIGSDGIEIRVVSAFRGVDRQAEIVRRKLARGLSLETIFEVSAPPGYSEHHTGRAVDVAMDGAAQLELGFGQTPVFRWLSENANSFSFFLSFPVGNPYGFVYEPWHWCFKSDVA